MKLVISADYCFSSFDRINVSQYELIWFPGQASDWVSEKQTIGGQQKRVNQPRLAVW